MASKPNGRFCWYELMVPDMDAAKEFYGRVAGWTTSVWEGAAGPYTMWMNGETPVGGMMTLTEEQREQGTPPCWLLYLSTPDVDATVAKIKELGGAVIHEMAVPEVGRFAVASDPQGGVFAVLEPEGDAPGHDGTPEVGEFSWHELATSDWEAAWPFYAGVFGWQESSRMDMGEGNFYQMFHRGAHPLGGMFNKPPEVPVVGWLTYFRVPDVNAAAETVKELGGKLLHGPMEVPGGDLIAHCMDPQGVAFAVHAVAGSEDQGEGCPDDEE